MKLYTIDEVKDLKKLTILLFVSIIISTGFLSGCDEKNNDGIGVEVVEYTVVTTWLTGNMFDDTLQRHYESGFYHDIPDDAYDGMYKARYKINGTIKNNAGKKLEVVSIIVTYYDVNNNEMHQAVTSVMGLPNGYTESFQFEYPDAFITRNYFDDINHVGFILSDKLVNTWDLYP